MDDATLGELRKELARLEVAETQVSAERRRLHHQIDFGFATESTRAREREVSAKRGELPRRIDSLRERLRAGNPLAASGQEPTPPEPPLSRLSQWSGIAPEAVAAEDAFTDELEL